MAIRHVQQLVDDLDGTVIESDSKPVRFGLDGVQYEIDLNEEHAAELRQFLARYVEAGRRVKQTRAKRTGVSQAARAETLDAIRKWARSAGYEVSNTGRIPKAVMEAYQSAE